MRAASIAGLLPLVAAACVGPPRRAEPSPEALRVRATTHPACVACAGSVGVDDGPLITLGDDSLTLQVQHRGRVVIPIANITRLEVRRGRAGSAGAAVKYGGIGALVGASVAALAAGVWSEFTGAVSMFDWGSADRHAGVDIGGAAVTGAIGGAVAGTVYGALAGTAVWQVVTVEQLRQELATPNMPNARLMADPVAPPRKDVAPRAQR